MSKFPGLVDFIVDIVSAYGPGVTVLCAGYGTRRPCKSP
jgi:hypothetical protein